MGRPAGSGKVVITREWCKGCRICVDLCPEGVLGLDGQDKAVVLHPEACTACLFCELHCPDLAVEVQVGEGRPGGGRVRGRQARSGGPTRAEGALGENPA